ncbi:hypothetical protein Q9R20_12380 [Microbacterium sp. PRF11]|uniref:hypothetical protein n=1 Tax=Microbacterium sp. PRF11 TaxID=2962593 RepID=UPI0028825A1C|nr:hypothetical protein [Microbacterium sp. PRF11]MDT0117783.1 hypothetical protein [Microbacterium sp. PRF11]
MSGASVDAPTKSTRAEVHISEAADGGILARFPFDCAAVDAIKAARTGDTWAAWLDNVGAWQVPRTMWRRVEQRLRALGYSIVHLSQPDQEAEEAP